MSLGTLRFAAGKWLVEAGPHIVMRLKRVFEKVDKGAHGRVLISDSLENCRDLLWFVGRHPLAMGHQERAYLKRRAAEYDQHQTIIAKVLTGSYQAPAGALAMPLRAYQQQAAALALATGRLLLADDPGLGKTASAIGVLVDESSLPALVVTLTYLPTQWVAELAQFAPHLVVHIIRGGRSYDVAQAVKRERRRRGDKTAEARWPDVLVVNYAKLAGWADALAGKMRAVVFDECQELRGGAARHVPAKYLAAKQIASYAKRRLGLSATPFYNYGGEMHPVMDVLAPGALGTRAEFLREWCGRHGATDDDADHKYDKPRIRDPKVFGEHMRAEGLMLRRTRTDVGRELPGLSKAVHYLDADPHAIDRAVGSRAAELAQIILGAGGGFDKLRAGGELDWRLRQATGIAKAPLVAEFVRLILESGEPVVLYGYHHEVYRLWAEALADFKPDFFTGQESKAQKLAAVRRFVSGDTKLLILSVRSGAGLDGLQRVCRIVVFGELDWSPGIHEQAEARVFRDGQSDAVTAYYLVATSGSDPVIADVLGLKRSQIDGVLNPRAELVDKLSTTDDRMRRLAQAWLDRHRGGRA